MSEEAYDFGTQAPDNDKIETADAQPDYAELRTTPRFSLLIRSAKLVYDDAEYICIVRDVSASGVRLRLFHPLPPQSDVTLELATGETFAIERVWEQADHGGFRFADPIDVHRFIAEAGPYPKRPLRLRVEFTARITADGEPVAVRVCDLSREGARIETQEMLAIGQRVKVEAKGLPSLTATVCWRSVPAYGLAFQQTFTLEELAHIARRLQPAEEAQEEPAPPRCA